MSVIAGLDGYAYRNTGTEATPVWTLIDCIRDLAGPISPDEIETSSRKSKKKTFLPGLEDWSIEGDLIYDAADANVTAFISALTGRTTLDIVALDGTSATSGSQGPRIIGHIYSSGRQEPLTDAQSLPFTIKPGPNATTPASWFTVP